MGKYKLLALDIDDTLLNSRAELSPGNLAAILRAQAAGVCVALCTGRSYSASAEVIARIGLSELMVINYGGVQITSYPSGQTQLLQTLTHDQAIKAIHFAKSRGLHVHGYVGEKLYYEQANECSDFYEARVGLKGEVVKFDQMRFDQAPKVLVIGDAAQIEVLYEEAKAQLQQEYNILRSNARFLEFYALGASKGVALKALAQSMGIAQSEVIAMGDETIDASMLEYAGLGVAVANAREALKQVADYIAPSCDEDAVAHVINQFIFEEA